VIRTFYQRLCQAGKAKKLALSACMRKLLAMLNAMLKSRTPWRDIASQPACFSRQLLTPILCALYLVSPDLNSYCFLHLSHSLRHISVQVPPLGSGVRSMGLRVTNRKSSRGTSSPLLLWPTAMK
jgi:hypothetical protein